MLTKEEFIKQKKIISIKSPEGEKEYIKIIKKLLELGYHTYDKTTPSNFFKNNYIVIFFDAPGGDIHPRIEPEGEVVDVSYILGDNWNQPSVELVVGEWYEVYSSERWLFKFDRFEQPDKLHNTLSGTPADGYTSDGGFLEGQPKDCKSANMEEVYELFPEERKAITSEFKSRVKFKIGDKVLAICNPTPFDEIEVTHWNPLSQKGSVVTVKEISTKHPDLFRVEEWEHWFMEDQFKLITSMEKKEENLPFKVGDKFRVTTKPTTWAGSRKYPLNNKFPYEGVVDEIYSQTPRNVLIDKRGFSWAIYPELFQKIEDEEWWKSLKKGDYVVCVEDTYSRCCANKNYVYLNYGKGSIWYGTLNEKKGTVSKSNYVYWRLATPEEINMFNDAGKPVDVTTYKISEEKKVVNCTTKEEYNFAASRLNTTQDWFNDGHTCINLNANNKTQSYDYYKREGFKILSFDEWCNEAGYGNPFGSKEFVLPEKWYIKTGDFEVINNWFNTKFNLNFKFEKIKCHPSKGGFYWFTKSEEHELKISGYTEITFEQFKEHVLGEKVGDVKDIKEDLLEEAKRRYPIGTKFYPAHISKHDDDWYFTVKSHKLEQPNEFPRNISFISDKPYNQDWVPNVYSNGKWAEIISSPKEKSIEKWSVGSYAVAIKGQFGCFNAGDFNDKKTPLVKGTVFTITKNNITKNNFSFNNVGVAEANYWIYKDNLKWFSTKEEAEAFAKTLIEPEQPKFVVGNWYKNVGSYNSYCKFEGFWKGDVKKIQCTEHITEKKYVKNISGYLTINTDTKKASLEEIQQYLPEGHVDKLVKEKKNVKSTYVNVRTQEQWDFVTKKLGYNWGTGRWDVYKQDSTINLHDQYYGNYCNDIKCCTFEQWLEDTGYTYPENKFNYKFKVGDKVKVIRSSYGCAPKEVNKEVEITERGDYIGDPGYKVSPAIGNTADRQFGGFIGEKSFKLVTSKEETYEVGDWVIANGNISKYDNLIGQIELINGNVYSDFNCKIDFRPSGRSDRIWSNIIRKATPEEIRKATGKSETMEKFVKGKWYYRHHHDGRTILCYKGNNLGYGFWRDKWDDNWTIESNSWREATDSEVKDKFEAYAKKHYPIGTEFNSRRGRHCSIHKGVYEWNERHGCLYGDNNTLYQDGKWAEVVSTSDRYVAGIDPIKSSEPQPRWKVGDEVTYKSLNECGRAYYFGGLDQGGNVGTIQKYREYIPSKRCFEISVTLPSGGSYAMLESEFREWDDVKVGEVTWKSKNKTKTKNKVDLIDVKSIL